MSSLFNFNIQTLDLLLKSDGIEKTWRRILLTHIQNKPNFKYIAEHPEFKTQKALQNDLIQGLSIGEIGVLYEYSVTHGSVASRKNNGQFFTPDDVANFMAISSKKFENGVWLDPCSGIGNLSWHLAAVQSDPETFILNNLILSDKDELALLIARTLLTVSFQKKRKNLFSQIENNFQVFDFLSVSDSGEFSLFKADSGLEGIPKHDFVIVNPPYLATQADARFECSKSGDLFAYFLENVIKSSRGFISITPQSFTNAKKFSSLRNLLLRSYNNLTIYCFDNVPANIFKGIKFGSTNSNQVNSIRASIMIALPGQGKRQITSLIRWKSSEREVLFKEAKRHLSKVKLTEDFFPKVGQDYQEMYESTASLPLLGSICNSRKTKFALYVPSAPRYFIPALKKSVKRSSQKTIYFDSALDRDRAYMLMNSSFMYWWWRVRDGGMTLSLETILSCPLLDFPLSESLIRRLEESEKKNKVYKQNAGSAQENVKHPKTLVSALNKVVAPQFASLLMDIHDNSDLHAQKNRIKTSY
jgi:hypothetical protein